MKISLKVKKAELDEKDLSSRPVESESTSSSKEKVEVSSAKEEKTKKKSKREMMIESVDLTKLSKPVNDAATSGPKKMKDFTQWPWWKSTIVGLIGVGFVIALWALYAYLRESNGNTSWLSSPNGVWDVFVKTVKNGTLGRHLGASMQRVLIGYAIALACSIPIGFAMAWYKPVRAFFDPFVQFLRCIPPIAYVPVVVAAMGSGEQSKYFIIFLAVFLTMTVTIYQGVKKSI